MAKKPKTWAELRKQATGKPVDDRQSAHRRGYDRRWEKARRMVLASHPLCADCRDAGRVTPASDVHHIVKVRRRPNLRLDQDNLLPLCRRCHNVRTARGE